MKFRIKVGEFTEQIAQALITVDPKSIDQPNSKVYLRTMQRGETGVLYYYSTNQTAKTFIKSTVEVDSVGDTLVDAGKLLGGLAGRDPDQTVQVDAQPEKIVVSIGRNRFNLPRGTSGEKLSKEADALPFKANATAKIPASFLSEVIRRSAFCIPSSSNGQQRFAMDVLHLTSSALKGWSSYATDGNILSINLGPRPETPAEEINFPGVLIPQEALNPLQKLLNKHKSEEIELVDLPMEDGRSRELFFRMSGVLFGCRLRNGKHPNIEALIEQHRPVYDLNVDRNEMKQALLRSANFVTPGMRWVHLALAEETVIKLQAASKEDKTDIHDEVASEFRDGSGTFGPTQITLALDYLANIVQTLQGEKVTLGVPTEKGRALFVRAEHRDENDKVILGSTYAVMPVKPPKS